MDESVMSVMILTCGHVMFAAGYRQLRSELRPGESSDGSLGNPCRAINCLRGSQKNSARGESSSSE